MAWARLAFGPTALVPFEGSVADCTSRWLAALFEHGVNDNPQGEDQSRTDHPQWLRREQTPSVLQRFPLQDQDGQEGDQEQITAKWEVERGTTPWGNMDVPPSWS